MHEYCELPDIDIFKASREGAISEAYRRGMRDQLNGIWRNPYGPRPHIGDYDYGIWNAWECGYVASHEHARLMRKSND